jgi:drug/metabolite transporter (DMT)-like permease
MAKSNKAPFGASLVVLSTLFYASYGIWTKLMGNFFDGYTASAYRSVLVILILLPIAIYYRRLQPLKLKLNWYYFVGLFLGALFTWGPLYYAYLHAGIAISTTVNYACIVIGQFFFGWLFAGERFTKSKLLSAGIGLIGLALVFSPSSHSAGWLALVGAAVSGISIGVSMVLTKKIRYNATQSTVALWSAAVLANFFMAFALHKQAPAFVWHTAWLYLLFFAIASVAASWLFISGIKLIDAGAAGVLGLLEIVFAVFFGVIFFHERPGPLELTGVLTILVAAAIPYIHDYNAQRGTLD